MERQCYDMREYRIAQKINVPASSPTSSQRRQYSLQSFKTIYERALPLIYVSSYQAPGSVKQGPDDPHSEESIAAKLSLLDSKVTEF